MKIIAIVVSAFFMTILLSSCTYDDMMNKFIPKEEAKLAEDLLTELRSKNIEYIKSKLSHEIKQQATDELLLELAGYFRSGELLSTTIIGSQTHTMNGVWQGNFSFEYQFTNGWNLANAAFRKVNNTYEIIGLNVYKTEKSQKEIHAFTLSKKEFKHYLILAIAILVPLFILVTVVYCIKTPIPKRKWLWVLFVLVGIFSVQLNWTTGQINIQPLSVNLLGGAIMAASPYSAWIISTSFPLGAVIFWFKRRRFVELEKEASKSLNMDAQ